MIRDITAEIEVAAPIARVWKALTGEGELEAWLGCLNYRRREGRVFHLQPDAAKRAAGDITGATHCKVVDLNPPRRFVFTWFYPDLPRTFVDITLEPIAGGTRVHLVHTGWTQFEEDQIQGVRDSLEQGWTRMVLPALKKVAER